MTEILYDRNKEQIYCYKDVEKAINAIKAYTDNEASLIKDASDKAFFYTAETAVNLMAEEDIIAGKYSLYLRLQKVLDEILLKKTNLLPNNIASTFRSMAVIVYIVYYLQSRINSLKKLNRDNDSAIEKCKQFIEFWEILLKPEESKEKVEEAK